jgi:integrase
MHDVAKGKTAIANLTRQNRTTGGKGTATRTVRLLGGIFTWAISQNLRDDNPTKGVQKYPDQSGERYLTSEEMARLGAAISESEVDQCSAAAIRLLILTGCRVGEILNLRWNEVDLGRGFLFLPDSKTGRKAVVLSAAATAVIDGLPRLGVFVIAGETAGGRDEKPRPSLWGQWDRVRRRANLEGVRLHDLRHSFASVGAGAGMGLPIIGKLLGHAQTATTARYAHLDSDPVRAAANVIAGKIERAMGGK